MSGEMGYTSPVNYSTGVDHMYEISGSNRYQSMLPPFQFRQRSGNIDWRKLSKIDVNKVAQELDFVTLQEHIVTVTFCNIDAVGDLDPLFVKLFRLGQYTIEYLLHSQEYLQSIIDDLEGRINVAGKDKQQMEQKIVELTDEVHKVKQESKKRRKIIQQQQMLIEAGASSYYQCPHCEKAFMNASFLQGHMQRRHPDSVNYIGDVIAHSQREQGKLGGQLRQLESELKSERENFNLKLQKAEEDKQRWAEQSRMEMDEWKSKEEVRWKEEINAMKETFISDINKLKSKEQKYQKTITNLQQTMDQRQSNLGELVDDFEEEKTKLRDYEERVISLEQTNSDKNNQIEQLSAALKKLRKDQQVSLQKQKDQIEMEQQRKMQELQNQMNKSNSIAKVAQLQKQMRKLASKKQETKPKQLFVSEDESESTDASKDPTAREKLKKEMAANFKDHLKAILDEQLANCGIDPTVPGISTSTLTNKLMVLKTQRQQSAKEIPRYYQMRETLRRNLDEELKRRSPAQPKPKKKASSTLKKARSSPSLQPAPIPQASSTPLRRKSPPVEKKSPKKKFASDSRVNKTPGSSPATALSQPNKRARTTAPKEVASVTKQAPIVTKKSPVPSPRAAEGHDISPWDTDDSEISVLPAPEPVKPTHESDLDDLFSSDDDDDDEQPQDKGRTVKDLTKSIERQLGGPRKKPPAGAVDVAPKHETKIEKFEHDEDDDSFVVSSLEENVAKTDVRPAGSRAPLGSGLRRSGASNSSNTYGTSVWGSGHKGTKDQTHEDSDWDDDLELEEILT
ncbi:cilium assembly protein DZIP1L-like [Clavelina lepadiformis]|uniref:cilium assembly protein DZIP1L-like n=1 Tax=Clavelina lepadiformis TaxID=159417 RepID=UPI004042627D